MELFSASEYPQIAHERTRDTRGPSCKISTPGQDQVGNFFDLILQNRSCLDEAAMASERAQEHHKYQPFRHVWSFLPRFYSCELLCQCSACLCRPSDDRRESDNQPRQLAARHKNTSSLAPCARVPTQSRGAPTNGRHQVGPLFCCRGPRSSAPPRRERAAARRECKP